jgi:UDP-3-O-[3-hydroxymyristoyl] glucosamine N-acyltransferase
MGHKLIKRIYAADVAAACDLELVGENLPITNVESLSHVGDGSLCFTKAELLQPIAARCVLIARSVARQIAPSVLVTVNPRLAFAKVMAFLDRESGFQRPITPPRIDPTARVSPHAVLGLGVVIGANTVVNHFVVIGEGVQVGRSCVIKSGAVIGEDGFGFERDDGLPVRLVHLGTVRIGDHVEIGSLTTVCRGTLTDTVIEDFAKIDDHVHIAHNCRVGVGAMVIACAEVSGGVVLGKGAWVGPNSSIIQQRKIGEGSLIGIGSNVLRDVPDGITVAGNPAKPFQAK